ncbi:Aste57867_23981 [Aphanomyces stellatus]|uniref:Phosphatidylcholine transfer protein n=1 Tax=Aphanomyces stellatus TaxID=120398 RepID=A0A485LPY2_9STRA|nr:hypothetical protein As57867_023908 [Aphanomyces stellatus]VFU00624.1 Aste57867_23981 [Aphanomyces stellatus]
MHQIHHSSPELTDEAIDEAMELAEESTWDARGQDETVYVEKQFELYRSISTASTLPKYYCKAWFPYKADTLFNVLHDLKYRKEWDTTFVKQAYVVDHPPSEADDVDVVYWCTKLPWPFSNRDYVFFRRTTLVKDTFVVLSEAGAHKDAPAFQSTQRIEVFRAHLLIRASGTNSCELFLAYSDESNYAVPNAVINYALSTSLPSYLNDLRTACANYAGFIRGLDDNGLQTIPSQLVRARRGRRNLLHRAFSVRAPPASAPPHTRARPLLHRAKSSSDAVAAPDDVTVQFKLPATGLVLQQNTATSVLHAVLGTCEKGSEAARHKQLAPGLLVSSINGHSVADATFFDVLERLQRAARPVTVGFKQLALPPSDQREEKPPIISVDNNNPSAVAVRYEDALHESLASAPTAGGTRVDAKETGGAVLCVERFQYPAGSRLVQIDDLRVVDMPLSEIVHHLRRNTLVKYVVLEAPAAPASPLKKAKSFAASTLSKLSLKAAPSLATSSSSAPTTPTKAKGKATKSHASGGVLDDYTKIQVTPETFEWAWTHVQLLMGEERHFSAAPLLEKLQAFMETALLKPHAAGRLAQVSAEMQAKAPQLDVLKSRSDQGMAALHEFNNDTDAGWRFGQTYFGVSTHWKPGESGTVWLKLDGICEGVDVFNTLAVVRETDLFHQWVPFCNKATLLANLARVELVTYVSIAIPLMQRDAVIHAFGINATYEHRCILLLGKSAVQDAHPDVQFPPVKGWNSDRMDLRGFRALIEPYGRTRARMCIVVNVDPKCPVPQSLLNFTIKKMAGILLYLLMKEAQKIERNTADERNPHVARILHDPFYKWLKPRMDTWFTHLEGRTLPPAQSVRAPLANVVTGTLYGQRVDAKLSPKQRTSSSDMLTSSSHVRRPSPPPLHRPVSDYLYSVPLWPYVLLAAVYSVCITRSTSWVVACLWKALLTCAWAWFGVAGLVTWQVRQQVHVGAELQRLRWRVVRYALVFELVSSTCVYIWTYYMACHFGFIAPRRSGGCDAPPSAVHFWLLANSFLVASVVVAVLYAVQLHI